MRKPCCESNEGNYNKGAWSKQEDRKLIDYIRSHGEGRWRSLPKAAGLQRCGKSCRLRWINYLRPDIKRGNFDQDEEDLIIKLHALLGNRWSLIAGRLSGRTDNEVKNYWNSHIKKKLIGMGIDPSNHKLSQTTTKTLADPRPPNNVINRGELSDTSSGSSSDHANTCNIEKLSSGDHNNNDVSTSGHQRVPSDNILTSCLEDESSGQSSHRDQPRDDLNLDLSISFPSPRATFFEESGANCTVTANCREIECGGSPTTLLLFR